MTEPLVLGIETSCDETGIGIVRGRTLLSNTIASSMDEHSRYGGVVPEVAARAHLEALQPSIDAALAQAGSDDTAVLAGGIAGFQDTGGEAVHETQRWAMERQVRMVAGTLVVGGLLGAKLIDRRFAYLSAGIGSGLIFAAATNTCAMARALSLLPWNRTDDHPTVETFLQEIEGLQPADIDVWRMGVKLNDANRAEMMGRIREVFEDYARREPDPDGTATSIMLAHHLDRTAD